MWLVVWTKILEIFYPNVCVLCGEVLAFGDPRGVCAVCEEAYPYLADELCSFCGKPLIDLGEDLCHDCQKKPHDYLEGRSMWLYEGLVKEAIHSYKYKDHKENGHLFAKELIRYYNGIKVWSVDLVIAVPLHPKRRRRRGYNQAMIIADYLAQAYGYELADESVLRRVKNTKPQKELTDKERLRNVDRAFEVHGRSVLGKTVLLVDDIYTTGSTIDGCARVLKEAGARDIYYIALAIGRGL